MDLAAFWFLVVFFLLIFTEMGRGPENTAEESKSLPCSHTGLSKDPSRGCWRGRPAPGAALETGSAAPPALPRCERRRFYSVKENQLRRVNLKIFRDHIRNPRPSGNPVVPTRAPQCRAGRVPRVGEARRTQGPAAHGPRPGSAGRGPDPRRCRGPACSVTRPGRPCDAPRCPSRERTGPVGRPALGRKRRVSAERSEFRSNPRRRFEARLRHDP